MERRSFLNLAMALGCVVAASAALLATPSIAAPLSPAPLVDKAPVDGNVQRAVTSAGEAGRLAPQQVHWHHHGYHGRGHHWGWGHHHWHHRHWGWHHRHWHHRHW